MDPVVSDLRGNKVDRESTKDINMKQRRVINAAAAQNDNDYIILAELKEVVETVSKNLTDAFTALLVSFKISWIYITKLVTSVIRPPKDDIFGISFTKADGKTVVMALDTLNSRMGVSGSIYSINADIGTPGLPNAAFIRIQYDPLHAGGFYGDIVVYDAVAAQFMPLAIRSSLITLGTGGAKLGLYTDNPAQAVVQQILAAYSSNSPGAYLGLASGLGGSPYASVNDLNNLRVAYNNLRVMCEDLRSKLQTSRIVG